MDNIQIQDGSGDRKYFTIIPNYIYNHSTAYDRDLYSQMKRIAGEDGTCWMSQKALAKQCGISINRLKKSIKYLIDHNWIKFIGKKQIITKGGVQEVNEYKVIDLWDLNNKFYQEKYKGISPDDTPIVKGVSRTTQRGITDEAKGVSPNDDKEEPVLNKNHIKKNHKEDATTIKQKFFLNPLMEEIKKQYPDRNYEFQFNLMCDWWLTNRKKLPQHLSAFSNWLKNTKPEIITNLNKYANVKIHTN